ncbi:MAG: carboxypeptidase regulatory-like domain-containing protein [Candidatus Korobacteraceae bacterium]
MSFQGRFLGLLISVFLGTFVNAQDFLTATPARSNNNSGVVTGAVLSFDGHPLSGVPVELYDANSTVVARAETAPSGTFALYDVPPGYYEVTSLAGGAEARRFVDLSTGRSTVELSFLSSGQPPMPGNAMISVAQMTVTESARKLYEKASYSVGKKDYPKARQWVDQALQRQASFPEALTSRAFLERNAHEIEAAARDCEAAMQIDPYHGPAYSTLASVYNLQGRYDDALRTLDEGVAVSPQSWQMYFEMAKASIGKRLYSQGLQLMDTAERLGGFNYPEIHLVRAYALVPLKFYREARTELQTFLARQPKGENAERARQLLASLNREEKLPRVELAAADPK